MSYIIILMVNKKLFLDLYLVKFLDTLAKSFRNSLTLIRYIPAKRNLGEDNF